MRSNEDLRKVYSALDGGSLLRIATNEVYQLRPEAVAVLKEELLARNLLDEKLILFIDSKLKLCPNEDLSRQGARQERTPPVSIVSLISLCTVALSVALFVVSLLLPAFVLEVWRLGNLAGPRGIFVLLFGWSGIFDIGRYGFGIISWYANLFLFGSWTLLLLLFLPSSRNLFSLYQSRALQIVGMLLALIGLGIAQCARYVKVFHSDWSLWRPSPMSNVLQMGVGYYLWMASFAACLLGNVINSIYALLANVRTITKERIEGG